jgi:hypothetical protein
LFISCVRSCPRPHRQNGGEQRAEADAPLGARDQDAAHPSGRPHPERGGAGERDPRPHRGQRATPGRRPALRRAAGRGRIRVHGAPKTGRFDIGVRPAPRRVGARAEATEPLRRRRVHPPLVAKTELEKPKKCTRNLGLK